MSQHLLRSRKVSCVLLSNVCVNYSAFDTELFAVPEGVDGQAFCKKMMESRSQPAQQSGLTIQRSLSRRFVEQLRRFVTSTFRQKVLAK